MEHCKTYNERHHDNLVDLHIRAVDDDLAWILTALDHATSYLLAISTFRDELQGKIANVLALLVDNNKAISNQLLLRNSRTMRDILEETKAQSGQSLSIATETRQLTAEMTKILHATRQETEASRQLALQSQRLTKEMMKDSGAMKTVALLTAFFLPGTSFAAVLSMPFFTAAFSGSGPVRAWIWVVLTVPATILCFGFYISWNHRETQRKTHKLTATGLI